VFDKDFRVSDSALIDYIQALPTPAHLKDPQNKRYIHTNLPNLGIYSLTKPQDLIGLSVYDVDEFMKPYWGGKFAYDINMLDQHVLNESKTIVTSQRVFLDKSGLVHLQDMIKTPVLNEKGCVRLILTTSFDTTDALDKRAIFRFYQKVYPTKRTANLFFMRHIKINHFFMETLSTKEIECLLCMIENNAYKIIATKMEVSLKMVEAHINHIANKMAQGSVSDVLEFLRMTSNDNIRNPFWKHGATT
jgi:DNA-binding CsgD family transcriptional regulator